MGARELAECHRDDPRNDCGEQEGENDRRSSDFERGRGSEEEARPDGSADGDHRHLAGAELMLQARFAVRRFDRLHDGCISEKERAQAPVPLPQRDRSVRLC